MTSSAVTRETNGPLSVAVIGGGASGMTAAIFAARSGAAVTLFERNDRVGKKLLVTGNGRCNLTDRDIGAGNYHGDAAFAMAVIALFDRDRTLAFFGDLGLRFMTDEAGRVFPFSQQAGSVLDALRFELDDLNVTADTAFPVASLKKTGERFELVSQGGQKFSFDRVVVACGGKADPDLGSDGSGFRLAQSFGHTVGRVFPSLVQLRLEGQVARAMERMKWEAGLRARVDGKVTEERQGDIIFTNYGISGTGVLAVSRTVVEALETGRQAELEIDLLPGQTPQETRAELARRTARHPRRKLEDLFLGWINKRIGQTLLRSLGHDLSVASGTLRDSEIANIAERVHGWRFPVSGHNGWKNAQVTAGGVKTSEVDAATLESKRVKGLYFAGEVLDVDGDSGGYNLQWAWSSGAVAGTSAAGGRLG
jgi:hypothetical protein